MTENPNIQPDPNAGQPPGGPGGTPPRPSTPPEPATSATPTGPASTEPAATAARPSEPGQAAQIGQSSQFGQSSQSSQSSRAGGSTATAAEQDAGAEYAEPSNLSEPGEPGEPREPSTGVAATFLPGIDADSVLALVVAALGAGAFLLVNPLVQAHDAARTWSDFKNNVPRTKQDPFGLQRDWVDFQSWGHIILGLVSVLLALLVLGMWTARRNRLRSRSFAQAALVLGLAVLLYGILLKTGAVGSEIPNMKDISTGLSSSSSQ